VLGRRLLTGVDQVVIKGAEPEVGRELFAELARALPTSIVASAVSAPIKAGTTSNSTVNSNSLPASAAMATHKESLPACWCVDLGPCLPPALKGAAGAHSWQGVTYLHIDPGPAPVADEQHGSQEEEEEEEEGLETSTSTPYSPWDIVPAVLVGTLNELHLGPGLRIDTASLCAASDSGQLAAVWASPSLQLLIIEDCVLQGAEGSGSDTDAAKALAALMRCAHKVGCFPC
jgi:hypothetical protein